MELTEAIRKRRSVRKYRDEAVPAEVLEELLNLACWAPSAENEQPWYYVALTSAEALQELQETMQFVADDMKVHLEELLPRHPRIVGQTTDFLRRLGGAPVCILVFLQKDYGPLRETMLESVAASIQTMLLLQVSWAIASARVKKHMMLSAHTAILQVCAQFKIFTTI